MVERNMCNAVMRAIAVLGLKNEAARFKRKTISAAIATEVKQFCRQLKTDEVFGAHSWQTRNRCRIGLRAFPSAAST